MDNSRAYILFVFTAFACLSIYTAQADELPSPKSQLLTRHSLAFKSVGPGLFDFHTGKLSGRLKLDGQFQGVTDIVDIPSGRRLTRPPGVFSFYRVFSANKRYGNAARDWPTTCKLLADGSVEVRWPAAKEHPVEISAVYRWSAPDTLDLQTTVKPSRDMPCFEMFLSSYFTDNFRASIYMKPAVGADAKPSFVAADPGPKSKADYAIFPRDAAAEAMISDGRWSIPPSPVSWDIEQWMAVPLAIRRDKATGITAAMMAGPQDCFAFSCRWNVAEKMHGYRSLYMSLFGKDLKAGQTATANCRLLIGTNLCDEEVVKRYEEYVNSFTSSHSLD